MDDIKNKRATGTWCGLPHNLYVPRWVVGKIYPIFTFVLIYRSTDYNPNEADLGGGNFVLLAFVNDVAQEVTEGSDGIEHM